MVDLKQLSYDSPASQDGKEMFQMLHYVANLEPRVIVEIGCDRGGFLETLGKAFPNALVIGIESVERDELYPYRVIYGDSHDTATVHRLIAAIRPRDIDFLFIDGDHHYEAVKKDFELYSPLVRSGGIIGFHDINSRDIEGVEAGRFFAELDPAKCEALQADENSPGTGLYRV